MELKELGWSKFFQNQLRPDETDVLCGRVAKEDLQGYEVMTVQGRAFATLPGRLRHDADSKAELPAVGDWVLMRAVAQDKDRGVISRVLARRTLFSRREPGPGRLDEQVIAANVDTVFIVTGLDGDFSAPRIERYLLLAVDSGATPVIILSKADVAEDLDEKLEAVRQVAIGTSIHVVSALTGEGMATVEAYMEVGKTIALLGSSGVGKSTLINALLGEHHFEVNAVRESDSKGRHTTTHRELVLLANGALIMDTPGMREVQLWSDEAALGASFEDVEDFAVACRFSDCKHITEPGCAVLEAIADDRLPEERLTSYRKLQRELRRLAAAQDAQARRERKTFVRSRARAIRRLTTKRDR